MENLSALDAACEMECFQGVSDGDRGLLSLRLWSSRRLCPGLQAIRIFPFARLRRCNGLASRQCRPVGPLCCGEVGRLVSAPSGKRCLRRSSLADDSPVAFPVLSRGRSENEHWESTAVEGYDPVGCTTR